MNERHIRIKPGNCIDLGTYLCPSEMILGRASVGVPSGNFDVKQDPSNRFSSLVSC